jgi:hypothetical protein
VVGFTTGSRGEVPGKKENLRQEMMMMIIMIIIIINTTPALATSYCWGDYLLEDKRAGTCSTYEQRRNAYVV